eukprot:g2700.t1
MAYLCIPVEACHFQYLSLSMLSWHHYWNRFFGYPVVIFVKAEDAQQIRDEVAPLRRAGIDARVTIVAPKWLKDPNIACPNWKQKSDEPCSRRFTESYRNMNRFFSKDMYWQPTFDNIDYFLRIDTDSFLVQIWCDDPFERMHRKGLRFLYNGIAVTNPNCHRGMRDAIDEFVSEKHVQPVSLMTDFIRPDNGERPALGFSGCVGAGSKHFFRHDNYTRFADFLRSKCGIYNHRWSEQVFFYYASTIYGTREQVGKIDSPHIHGRDKNLWMTCLKQRLSAAGYNAAMRMPVAAANGAKTEKHREWKYMNPGGRTITAVLKSTRNPIDEYDSWRRWRGRHPEWPRYRMSFREFASEWAKFHRHWDVWSEEHCTPIVEFKFEELVRNPRGVLRGILRETGLWRNLALDEERVSRALRIVNEEDGRAHAAQGTQVTGSLTMGNAIGKTYRGKQFGRDMSLTDLAWFESENADLLERYGYTELFTRARAQLTQLAQSAATAEGNGHPTNRPGKLIVLSAPNAWLMQPTLSCPLQDCAGCEFSVDKSRMKDADAVIFFARYIPETPPPRPTGQLWVFFTTESRRHFPELPAQYNDAFNLTMTYKLNSDVAMTYLDRQWFRLLPFQDSTTFGEVRNKTRVFLVSPRNRGKLNCDFVQNKDACKSSISGAFLNMGSPCEAPTSNEEYAAFKLKVFQGFTTRYPEKTKDAPIMFMASNPIRCHQNCDKNNRIEYVEQLMKHTRVDSYGLVLHNKESVSVGGQSYTMSGRKHGNWERPVVIKILSAYKFYLAFENSNCDDYLTEKFFRPLLAGSVPVVLGGCDYAKFAPTKESYLHVKDFTSPAELAAYINKADKDANLYRTHLAWRELTPEQWSPSFRSIFSAEKPDCKLCKLLHRGVKQVHRNINQDYWSRDGNCAADGWGISGS